MSNIDTHTSLQAIAARLPFGLDQTGRVGAAFQRWRDERQPSDKRVVDLWTYCFVRRYFLVKFAGPPEQPASDFDELVERAYRKVERRRETVEQADRYPHWVSVLCKNLYLNYLRRARAVESIDREDAPPLTTDREGGRGDIGLAHRVVSDAIGRLPSYLQDVARMRFLEEYSYREISEKTGTAVPTARSYAGRARQKLREDADVQALSPAPT